MYKCACGLLTTFGYIDGAKPRKKPKKKKTKAEQDALKYTPICFECWCKGGQKEAIDHMPVDESHPDWAELPPEVAELLPKEEKPKEKKPDSEEKYEGTKPMTDEVRDRIKVKPIEEEKKES
jgi:hypothetical protein